MVNPSHLLSLNHRCVPSMYACAQDLMHKHPSEFVCLFFVAVASFVPTAVRIPEEQWSATGQA